MATKRKMILLDEGVLQALELLSRETGTPLEALADQAFRELLKKRKRPATLNEALRASLRTAAGQRPWTAVQAARAFIAAGPRRGSSGRSARASTVSSAPISEAGV